MSSIVETSRPAVPWALGARSPAAIIYILLGFLGVLALVFLTPPLQVSDEQEHFDRAFQLSELSLRGIARNNGAGAILPSSLVELADRFLGTRKAVDGAPPSLVPRQDPLDALSIPLDPSRREFVDFFGAVFYSPLPYLPQIAAILVGRGLGFGPLELLYAARLANGVTALLLSAAALRILPAGNMTLLVLALLPTMLFQFASASADAGVISTALLFTAIATRASWRGRWRLREIALACLLGAVFCSAKPPYAPLLVIGMPGVLRDGLARHVIAVHAVIVGVVAGITVLWLSYAMPGLVVTTGDNSVPRQLAGILADPGGFAVVVARSVLAYSRGWVRDFIGMLGWQTIPVPKFMVAMAMAAIAASLAWRRPTAPRITPVQAIWYAIVMATAALLILTALYLDYTPVGGPRIEGVQGRYFSPFSALIAVTAGGLMPSLGVVPRWLPPLVVVPLVAAGVALTPFVVLQAFQVP